MTESAQPVRTTAPPGHLAYLDGLRACAALFVVIHHIMQTSEHGGPFRGAFRVIAPFHYGHFAVSFFIVISGFSLMLPVVRAGGTLRGGAQSFFRRRAKRILPPYYFAMALSLVCVAMGVPDIGQGSVTRLGIASHVLLLHNWFPGSFHQINISFWSIAVEWQIYFLFPMLIVAWRKFGGVESTLVAAAVSYVTAYLLRHTVLDGLTLHYIGLFALGMASAAIATSAEPRWVRIREGVPWAVLGFATLGVLVLVCCLTEFAPLRVCDVAVAILGMVLLIVPVRPGWGALRAILSWRPLVLIGGFAYSIYLMHVPILRLIVWGGLVKVTPDSNAMFARLFACGLPLVLLGSYAFYWACERPFLSSAPRAPAPLAPGAADARKPSGP